MAFMISEEEAERKKMCGICKYWKISVNDEPCFSCGDKHNWVSAKK